ncbi:MAG: GNAT family N-acetyltransferase [Candidatus Neomarinimicrobiota bacterium]
MLPSDKLIIRKAVTTDLTAIVKLWIEFTDYHSAMDRYFSRSENGHNNFSDYVQKNLSSNRSRILVAQFKGMVIGYCIGTMAERSPVFKNRDYGYIQDLIITRSYRGQGGGQSLINELVKWFKSKGVTRLELDIHAKNEVARNFWMNNGFAISLERLSREI